MDAVVDLTHAVLAFSTLRAQMDISIYRHTEMLHHAAHREVLPEDSVTWGLEEVLTSL